MPLRRPTSPLALETCSHLAPDIDEYGLLGSDDDLDETQSSAQRRRIEKLGEAYLEGTSLFILSASLRGPLGGGWVNPWKKNRRKAGGDKDNNGDTEQPVIPETNSRKRRHYHSPSVISCSRKPATPLTSPRRNRVHEGALGISSKDQVSELQTTDTDSQSSRFTRFKPTQAGWLKKDNVSTRFQNIDPPTSPTTTVSSRKLRAKGNAMTSGSGSAGYELASSSQRLGGPKQHESSARLNSGANGIYPNGNHPTPDSKRRESGQQSKTENESLHVVSSSSQLPKFEYRLKKHDTPNAKVKSRISPKPNEDGLNGAAVAGHVDIPSNGLRNASQEPLSTRTSGAYEAGTKDQHNFNDSLTLTNASGTVDNGLSSNLEKELAMNMKNGNTSENNLPSAQPVHGNQLNPDNLTSLYSIAVSKATSHRTEDQNPEQFSTQAALMMAQKSFQDDLRSPERSPLMSGKKRRASQASSHHSPAPVNITPFHKINTSDRRIADRASDPNTGRAQMISTQYMIDAATPFTFSTQKKPDFCALSSEKEKSRTKKQKATSFALSSPSEILSEQSKFDQDRVESDMQQAPMDARDSSEPQFTGLPMTLTGTTPPTAQEGQGAESFNLSQAIAEAGSWLQQSFEINKDITHCKNTKLPQLNSADTAY